MIMIQKELFWNLIAQSINEKKSIDKNDQGDALMEILGTHPVKTIVDFHLKTRELLKELDFPMMEDIAFMMGYNDNPTAFEGFRNWVISLGEQHFEKAKNSPAHLLTLKDSDLFVVGRPYFPDLNFVASGAYYTLTDKDISDWNDEIKKRTKLSERMTSLSDSKRKNDLER